MSSIKKKTCPYCGKQVSTPCETENNSKKCSQIKTKDKKKLLKIT